MLEGLAGGQLLLLGILAVVGVAIAIAVIKSAIKMAIRIGILAGVAVAGLYTVGYIG